MRSPLDEVKLSYKDLVQVWHPDRFTHSPRLQEKAANKLLQLNEAYDTLKDHLERQAVQGAYAYGTASYGSTGYGAASQTATRPEGSSSRGATGDWATGTATTGERATASAYRSRPKAASDRKVPSFFDSGGAYSWKWQLQATGLIFGLVGLLLLPIGLTMVISQYPLLLLLLMPLPVMAYVYRAWVTR